MSQAKDELVARAQDPNAELETLHQLAQNYPGLRPYIAANPRTYPALLEWLGTLGDPAVDAALASRNSQPQSAPSAQSAQSSPQLAVVSPPGAQHSAPSARSSEAPTQVTLPRSLQPGSAVSGASAVSATSSRSAASAPSAFNAAGANTQVDGFQTTGDPTISVPTSGLAQAMAPQSPARPVQPALQQTFQQSANVSQAQSPVIPTPVQQAPAVTGDDGVFGVGTEDDDSEPPSSFLTSNRILLILALLVATVLVFLATWYLSGGSDKGSAADSGTEAPADSGQAAAEDGSSPAPQSASPKASATPSASATPTLKAPAPQEAQELSGFDAPSGNISCTLNDNNLTCVINEHAKVDSCDSSKPLTVTIGADGNISKSCGSPFTTKGVSLSYGSSAKHSTFACKSTDQGMQCWSQVTGKGFILSRDSVVDTHGGN